MYRFISILLYYYYYLNIILLFKQNYANKINFVSTFLFEIDDHAVKFLLDLENIFFLFKQ